MDPFSATMDAQSSPYQVMMDRFERRKKYFKCQVNDMIDGLFDEMLSEVSALAGFTATTSPMPDRRMLQLTFSQRLNEILPETMSSIQSELQSQQPFALQVTAAPSTSSSAAPKNGHQMNVAPSSVDSSRTSLSDCAFYPEGQPLIGEPLVKLEVEESAGSEGTTASNTSMLSSPASGLLPRKRPRATQPLDSSMMDESSQEEGMVPLSDGKHVGTRALKCWIGNCGAMIEGKTNLNLHFRAAHPGVKPYRCISRECTQEFHDRSTRGAHIRSTHDINLPLDCYSCQRTFKNPTSLTTHINLVHEEGLFHCTAEGCTHFGPTRETIRKHIRLMHPKFICALEGCGKSFNLQAHLEAHQRKIHGSARPFRCTFEGCPGYTASRRGQVVAHVRVAHFGLNMSVRRQRELGIPEERHPYSFVQLVG